MKVAVLCAMQREAEELLNHFNFVDTHDVGGLTVYEGKYRGNTVYITVSGIGKVYAASAAQLLISRYNPAFLINVGLAGGCKSGLSAGSVVVADKLVMHDFDYSLSERFSGCPEVGLPDDEAVRAAYRVAKQLELEVACGTVATGDVFVEDAALKQDITTRTDCLCVDMEGAAVAAVCERNKVRFCSVKIISDSADENAYDNFAVSVNRYCYISESIVLGIIAKLD